MRELNIQGMMSVRSGQTSAFDIRRSFNGSNVSAIVSAGKVAEALPDEAISRQDPYTGGIILTLSFQYKL